MYIIYGIYDKNNFACIFVFLRIPLIPWKLTSSEHWMNFFSVFVSLMTYLGYIFLLDVSIFTTIDDEKEIKINLSSIVKDWGESFGNSLTLLTLCNLHNQKTELHTKSEDISEIKLDSLLPSARNSHLIIWTVIVFNIFYLILIIALPLIRFWIIGS